MYESFFGFSERPFAAAPTARHYFPGAAIEAARQNLTRCVERAEGIGLLVGPAGTGKTLLCHVLAEEFRGRCFIALLDSGRICTRRAMLQAISYEIGLPYRGIEEGDLRLAIVDRISPRKQTGEVSPPLVVLVDEAHALPLRLLEELRLLSNVVRNGEALVRVVLAGGPALEERLASPKLESFNQRISARCYLEALDRAQTIDYIREQLHDVGGQVDSVFAADALDVIYQATGGIPRLINQVCDHALILAFAGGVRQLTAAAIEEAWSDLQQLPTPWNSIAGAPSRDSDGPDIVEFGALEDALTEENPAVVPLRAIKRPSEVAAIFGEINVSHEAGFPSSLSGGKTIGSMPPLPLDAQGSADDDFEPAGSIGPEVELDFGASADPFSESFDEEEVVLDPYASIETDALANRPLVESAEGRELGALLAPFTSAEKPKVHIETATWAGGLPSAPDLPLHELYGDVELQFHSPTDATPAVTSTQIHSSWTADSLSNVGAKTARVDSRPIELDDDLIVIEEPPGSEHAIDLKPRPKVRRKEYRQLFNQLRRG